MTAIAIGARNSPPSPNAKAEGSIPAVIAIVVMMIVARQLHRNKSTTLMAKIAPSYSVSIAEL
jgi:hypothetical protein